jgi:hypothetical protein
VDTDGRHESGAGSKDQGIDYHNVRVLSSDFLYALILLEILAFMAVGESALVGGVEDDPRGGQGGHPI